MTELEQLLSGALAKQNEQVNALTEQVEDLITEHSALAAHVEHLSEQLHAWLKWRAG